MLRRRAKFNGAQALVEARVNPGLPRYLEEHGRIIRLTAGYVLWACSPAPVKLPLDGVVEAVGAQLLKHYALVRPYRLRIVLSTAAQLGAFEAYGVWLRRGVGFTTAPSVARQQLLATKEAA